jgi:septin 3/9/12
MYNEQTKVNLDSPGARPTDITGQTGLGKSTLVNTLFASHLVNSKGRFDLETPIRSTTEINQQSHVIIENGVRLKLNIIDTPGYGDQINNDGCWEPIVKHVSGVKHMTWKRELTVM